MLSKNRILILLYVLFFTLGVAGCAKKGVSDAENFPKSEEEQDLEGEFLSQGKEIDINLADIFFDYDQSGINSGSRVILD
ncbi:MAG: hypothetical protein ACRENO_04310, partial [Thermodesulfobacteriota bacterium]